MYVKYFFKKTLSRTLESTRLLSRRQKYVNCNISYLLLTLITSLLYKMCTYRLFNSKSIPTKKIKNNNCNIFFN